MQFVWQTFAELSGEDLYRIIQARLAVFVVEQECPFQDLDGLDVAANHLSVLNERREMLGYLRLLPSNTYDELPSIGRVLTMAQARGTGLGRRIVAEGLRQARAQFPGQPVSAAAQMYLKAFYASFGFEPAGEPYLEDGIEHLRMVAPA